MKHAHEAAAYDKWFRVQVQAALDDPRLSIPHEELSIPHEELSIPHEEVKAEFAKKRDALRKRAAAGG